LKFSFFKYTREQITLEILIKKTNLKLALLAFLISLDASANCFDSVRFFLNIPTAKSKIQLLAQLNDLREELIHLNKLEKLSETQTDSLYQKLSAIDEKKLALQIGAAFSIFPTAKNDEQIFSVWQSISNLIIAQIKSDSSNSWTIFQSDSFLDQLFKIWGAIYKNNIKLIFSSSGYLDFTIQIYADYRIKDFIRYKVFTHIRNLFGNNGVSYLNQRTYLASLFQDLEKPYDYVSSSELAFRNFTAESHIKVESITSEMRTAFNQLNGKYFDRLKTEVKIILFNAIKNKTPIPKNQLIDFLQSYQISTKVDLLNLFKILNVAPKNKDELGNYTLYQFILPWNGGIINLGTDKSFEEATFFDVSFIDKIRNCLINGGMCSVGLRFF
jgi:hypothetical protein